VSPDRCKPVSSLAISFLAFSVIFSAALLGILLPGHLLPEGTRDVVRLGAGLIGTIAGLVLGLLIASAHSSYEMQSNQVRHMTADVILLDNLLEQYGPQTHKARVLMRTAMQLFVERTWMTDDKTSEPFKPTAAGEALYFELDRLVPQDDAQRSIKTRALATYFDFAQNRLLLEQNTRDAIPMPFLVVLVAWLAVIFFSFGLFAKHHYSVALAVFIFALSASGSLFLILELTHPFSGLMQISNKPVLDALAPLAN
jgi:hypothetical protein